MFGQMPYGRMRHGSWSPFVFRSMGVLRRSYLDGSLPAGPDPRFRIAAPASQREGARNVALNANPDMWDDQTVRSALDRAGAEGARFFRQVAESAALSLSSPEVMAELVEEVAALQGRFSVSEAARLLPMARARALARVRGKTQAPGPILRRTRQAEDAATLSLERPYVGFFALERYRVQHRRFDDSLSASLDRLVFASGDAVTVLPYDPRRDRVLLIEQFRAGPYARKDRLPWCLEAIAGRCEADEDVEETARREAQEEAGLDLGRLERVLGYYTTPAIAAEHITAFVGEADLGEEHGFFGLETEHEDIRAFAVPRAEALAALASGEANNAPLALSLLWLELNAERLRRAWSG